jgi:hypothetical protein
MRSATIRPSLPHPTIHSFRSRAGTFGRGSCRVLAEPRHAARPSGRSGVRRSEGERLYPWSIRIARRPIFLPRIVRPRGSFAPDLGPRRSVALRLFSATRTLPLVLSVEATTGALRTSVLIGPDDAPGRSPPSLPIPTPAAEPVLTPGRRARLSPKRLTRGHEWRADA